MIFSVPAQASTAEQEEMNKFLRGHRILEVQQQYDTQRAFWTFAISYLDTNVGKTNYVQENKIDWKAELEPAVYERFSRLRERRKVIANDEKLPAFAVFTDKELVEIAKQENPTKSSIQKIDGINTARADRYAERILSATLSALTSTEKPSF